MERNEERRDLGFLIAGGGIDIFYLGEKRDSCSASYFSKIW